MQLIFVHPVVIFLENTHLKYVYPSNAMAHTKGPIFSEKDWYYLQTQTDMPFHNLKLLNFPAFLPLMTVRLA